MKTLGVLGGMSAESTQLYYAELCRLVRERLGGLHSPELLIRSIDFETIERLQMSGAWDEAGRVLNREARALQAGGAGILVLATNTMHKLADPMMEGVAIPLLHIADATAGAIRKAGLERPGLIATAFTMEEPFYVERLRDAGLDPSVPGPEDRAAVHRIIYDELCTGLTDEQSRRFFVQVAERLVGAGADCLILGCTEVGMLLNAYNVPVPVFDTTLVHCEAAVDRMLEDVRS